MDLYVCVHMRLHAMLCIDDDASCCQFMGRNSAT